MLMAADWETLRTVGTIPAIGLLGGLLGWIIREFFEEKKAQRMAEREYQRQIRARLHERRASIAELALTNLHTTVSSILGLMYAWRGQIQGKIRVEVLASLIESGSHRISQLSEEGQRATLLLRFWFGDEVAGQLNESDADWLQIAQTLSEFIATNNWMHYYANEPSPEGEEEQMKQLDVIFKTLVAQSDRIDLVIGLVEKRQSALRSLEDKLREIVQPVFG